MNKLMRFGSILCALILSVTSHAQSTWEEGKHYTVISDKASSSPVVREVFSYWCPHCFTFEPIVAQMKGQLPEGVSFIKAHSDGGLPARQAATLGMLAARAMKDEARYTEALFNAIHKDRKQPKDLTEVAAIYAAAGGDADRMVKMASSFGIKGQLAKNGALTRGLNSVPAFIVNDKYQAQFTRDMTPDSFVELIIWLSSQS